MSKKSRLDETTIRRFMGLSGIGALGENFIDRLREEDDLPPEEEAGAEAPLDAEAAPPEDLGAEPEAGPPTEGDATAATEMAQDVADAVAGALTDALSQHGVEVTSGEAGAEGEAPPMDDLGAEAPPEDLGAEAPPEDLGAEEPPMDDLEEAGIDLVDDDALVQEVARRVAARLMRESKKAAQPTRRTRRTRRTQRKRQ